ncbi:hypothetical protein AWENTII_008566 [Aspergillus wentii]
MLTHTLHLPPALSEIYGGPRPEWLKEILEYLPCLQSLMVSKLPFFDHNAMTALKSLTANGQPWGSVDFHTYNIRLLLAEREPNTTSQGVAETLLRFQELIYLDLSYTKSARDSAVLSALSQLEHLQVLKLRAIGLKDTDAQFLANAIGTRVRFLDLRENVLTDMAVRSLLQASFLPPNSSSNELSRDRETARSPNAIFESLPTLARLDFLKRSDLDEQFIKMLTRPLTGRSWVENLPHAGITHLYIAGNQITVEGVASLLASERLHALDVGTVDTAASLHKGPGTISPPKYEDHQIFPGAEKLIPILGVSAKESLTYLRAHHPILTSEVPFKDFTSPNVFLPELPDEGTQTVPERTHEPRELDATNEIHEMPTGVNAVYELADTSIPAAAGPSSYYAGERSLLADEPPPVPRRGSAYAPEVVGLDEDKLGPNGTGISRSRSDQKGAILTACGHPDTMCSEMLEPVPQCSSPLSTEDPRAHIIRELLAKRPKNQTLPRRDSRDSNFPHLHPSHIPHLETLVLTDVPSHVPANSPILTSLIRFITACSNEALLATLQAGSDYSLPPGRSRLNAEQQRSRSLFGLRRLVLEITPTPSLKGPAKLTPWRSVSYQNGTSKSSTGDWDSENMWSAAMSDFSFFGEDECGIPEKDPGKYFPMAALNEKVTLMPEDDDSVRLGTPEREASSSPNLLNSNRQHSQRGRSRPNSITSTSAAPQPSVEIPEVDLVAELASFRRTKKMEYEGLMRTQRSRRSTNGTTSSLRALSISSSPSLITLTGKSAPLLSMAHFVEGHWKGEVKIVRNAAPKGRSGVVDMYGNYFEKGYLYP